MDIDEARLAKTAEAAEAMVENGGLPARIESTTDRRQALEGADYVLNMINVGGTEPFQNEIRIPERYGVEQAIGDTLGPGGVFRGLRTIPTMLEIARDVEEVCPDALLLNYTNPMAIVCWALAEATEVETVGLCHSVPPPPRPSPSTSACHRTNWSTGSRASTTWRGSSNANTTARTSTHA